MDVAVGKRCGTPCLSQAAFLDRLAAWRREHPLEPVVVVGPSWEACLQATRRLAERLAGACCLGVYAITPGSLVQKLSAPDLAEAGIRELSPWGLEYLAWQAARRRHGYYRMVADRPGFTAALARTVAFLRAHGVSPEKLKAAAEHAPGEDRPRLSALSALYEDVSRRLAFEPGARWADPAARFVSAIRSARAGQAAQRLGASHLILWAVDFLFDPAHLWHALVNELQAPGSGLTVEHVPAGAAGDEAGLPPDVEAVAAPDEVREAELAVQQLLRAADGGVPFYRMAVVVRQDEPYRHLVADAMRRAGITAYVPGAERLSQSPAARALLGWLELVETELPRAPTLEWLASSPLKPGWLALSREGWQVGAWDPLSARAGIVGGFDQWESRLMAAEARLRESAHWQTFAAAARRLVAEARAFPREGSWRELSRACRAWLGAAVEEGEERDRVDGSLESLEALDELRPPDAPVSLDLFREAIRAAFEREGRSSGRFEQGGPALLSAHQLQGCSFALTVAVGLTDPGWPQEAPRDPLLSETDLERLGLGTPGERAAWRSLREQHLFGAACASAERRLVLSWPRAEALTGKERVSSPFLNGLSARLAKAARPSSATAAGAAVSGEPVDRAGFDVQVAARWPRHAWGYLQARYPEAAAGAEARRRRWSQKPGPWDGLVDAAVASGGALPAVVHVSPTGLETYARCPRRFFFSRRLHVSDEEVPEEAEGLLGSAKGSVLHRALQIFFERWLHARAVDGSVGQGSGHPPGPPQPAAPGPWRAWLWEALDAAIEENFVAVAALPGVARLQRELVFEALSRFVSSELEAIAAGPWQPRAFEREFDDVKLAPADSPTLHVHGRVDRLDVCLEQAGGTAVGGRVVDYKTRAPRPLPGPDRLERGQSLQLPLYLQAASTLTGLPVERCEAQFVFIGEDGTRSEVVLPGTMWCELEPALLRVVGTLGNGLASGTFMALPDRNVQCSGCAFYPVCGPEARRQAERKRHAAPAQALLAMRAEVR